MRLRTRLAALLELALESTENVVEGEFTFVWLAHASTHLAQAPQLHRWSALLLLRLLLLDLALTSER